VKRRRFLQHCAATAGGLIVPGLVLPEIARPANVALHLSPQPGGGGGESLIAITRIGSYLSPAGNGPGFTDNELYTQSVNLGTAGADQKVLVILSGLVSAVPDEVVVDSLNATEMINVFDGTACLSAWIIDNPGGTVDISARVKFGALDLGFEVFVVTKSGDADATLLDDSAALEDTATLNFSTSGNAVFGAALSINSTCVLTSADVTQDIRSTEWYSSKIDNDQSGSYTFSMTCTPSANVMMGLVF
jgi:hypothetical protein